MLQKALAFSLLSALTAVSLSANTHGSINGVVLTEEGLPAVNFQVCTQVHSKQSGTESTQTSCSAITDSTGQFTLKDLEPGTYEILAGNDAEGYSIDRQSPGTVV